MTDQLPVALCVIGASAGGLDALQQFFEPIPEGTGIAWIVVQHLSPDHRSLMPELLARHTPLPVCRAEDGMAIQPDTIYLNSPKVHISIEGNVLRVLPAEGGTSHLPIDRTFTSLAAARADAAIGIVLSGTGSDGTRGAREIKAAGGTVFVQDPAEAQFDGMPRSVMATGVADRALSASALAGAIIPLVVSRRLAAEQARDPLPDVPEEILGRIVDLLRGAGATDFSAYKRATITRRLDRRRCLHGDLTWPAYVQLLVELPDELQRLHRDLLINVTRFFRDEDAFGTLASRVIPDLLRESPGASEVRVWVPACSSGEEPYSLIMLLLEAMEATGDRRDLRVYATDVDTEALEYASAGRYPESIAADVGADRLQRHFTHEGERYRVSRRLRDRVIFARHDLLRDPPLRRMDLVSCRNVLIYLLPEAQRRILANLSYALRPGGVLFLGASESLGALDGHFETLDAKWKLFRNVSSGRASVEAMLQRPGGLTGLRTTSRAPMELVRSDPAFQRVAERAQHDLADAAGLAALVVDANGHLIHSFGSGVRALLSFVPGRPSLDIFQLLPRPAASAARAALGRAAREQHPVRVDGVSLSESGPTVAVQVRPLGAAETGTALFLMLVQHAGDAAIPTTPLFDGSAEQRDRVGELEREVQQTRENLQATIEELETSNEELQAANEELLASNEELQSANEELQSVNEELQTVNAEYHEKLGELGEANADIEHLLYGTGIGTLFLDSALRIRRFTEQASRLFHVLPQDLGRPLAHLSSTAHTFAIVPIAQRVRDTGTPEVHDVSLESGHTLQLHVFPYRGTKQNIDGVVLSLVDITAAAMQARALQATLDALPASVACLDAEGSITRVNATWSAHAAERGAPGTLAGGVGLNYLAACDAAGDDPTARTVATGLRHMLHGEREAFAIEYPCHGPNDERFYLLQARRLSDAAGGGVLLLHTDVTTAVQRLQALEDWKCAVEALTVPGLDAALARLEDRASKP